jgi:predicted DNA-binding transcriptional regulator AlpA
MLASIADERSENLTLAETADWLRCSSRTLQRLLETGEGPPVVRLSERRLIFRLADVRRWVEQRTSRKDSSSSRRRGSSPNPLATR